MDQRRKRSLGKRFEITDTLEDGPISRPAAGRGAVSRGASTRRGKKIRRRQSLHFSDASYEKLDQAYKKVAHAAYPAPLDKAPFIEAMIEFCVTHLDEVAALAQEIQEEEP